MKKNYSVRLETDLEELLRQEAEKRGMKRAAMIRRAVLIYVLCPDLAELRLQQTQLQSKAL